MRRRALLLLLAAAPGGWAGRAHAAQSGAAPSAETATPPEATGPIVELDDALVRIMRLGHATPFAQRAAVIAPVIAQVFDLPRILQVSVGLHWAEFAPAQQAKLLDVFTRYTIASYVANFDGYGGERFEILPQTRAVGADQVVATEIVPRSGDPTRIDYQMRHGDAGWQAVDVLLDGTISRVAVQRSDFRSLLKGDGPERLIASLEHKVTKLQVERKS